MDEPDDRCNVSEPEAGAAAFQETDVANAHRVAKSLHRGLTLGGEKAPRARPLYEKGLIGT
jgi:hypothetical protein